MRFPRLGENPSSVDRGSKLTNSLVKQNMNFRLARDQVVLLETAVNFSVSQPE